MIKQESNQRGQGTLEYILLIFVIMAISVGLLYQFNVGVRNYINAFFGEQYIQCLLESGELPRLNLEGSPQSECVLPEFGYQPEQIAGDGSSSSSSGDRTIADSSTKDSSSGSGGQGERAAAPRVNAFNTNNGNSGRPSTVPAKVVKKGGDSSEGDETVNGGVITSSSSSGNSSDGRERFVSVTDGKKKRDKPENVAAVTGEDDSKGGRKRFVAANLNPEKANAGLIDETDWTFGGLLRLLIIVGIIIAIFVLLIGQAVQIKKGMEK